MSPQEEVGRAEVLWLLGSLSGLYRLPFDANLIAQEFPPPYTLATFHQAARSLGLKTGEASLEGAHWQKLPLPAVAFLRPVPTAQAASNETGAELTLPAPVETSEVASDPAPAEPTEAPAPLRTPILLLKADNQQLLYFRPGSQTPETLPLAEAAQWLEPELILVAKESGTAGEEDIAGFKAEKKEFGFQWFVPELLKHKSIWRDILTASLAIQLVGLATPLFTQVIIDKVVVHQTHSTLIHSRRTGNKPVKACSPSTTSPSATANITPGSTNNSNSPSSPVTSPW